MLSAKLSSSTTSSGANHSGKVGGSSSIRSGSLPPGRHSSASAGTSSAHSSPSPNALHTSPSSSFGSNHLSSTSAFLSTGNLTRSDLYSTSRMSYILISSEHLHRGPTSISTTDPYLAEKCPFTVIKDTVYFQVSRPASLKAKVMNKVIYSSSEISKGTNMSFLFFVFVCFLGRAQIRSPWPVLVDARRGCARASAEQAVRPGLQGGGGK